MEASNSLFKEKTGSNTLRLIINDLEFVIHCSDNLPFDYNPIRFERR